MQPENTAAARAALLYALAGGIWIFGSDALLGLAVAEPARYGTLQTAKGVLFIVVTAVLLYWLLRRELVRRREVDDAHRLTAEKLQAVIASSPLAICALDLEGCVTMWSPAAERMYGWTQAEVLGERLPAVAPEVLERYQELIDRAMAGELITDVEVLRMRRDSTMIHTSLSAAPLRDGSGAIAGVLSVSVDLTGRKRLEEKYYHAQKMEAVGRLAGGIGHDFNNLLTAIIGYGRLLHESLDSDDPRRDDAEQLLHAADSAGALTRQLLTISRLRVHKLEELDLNAVVGDLEKILRMAAGEGVALELKLEARASAVSAAAGQVEQVLMNLVVNARDAMPGGGKVTIETREVELDEEHARAHLEVEPGSYVLLAVSDTGTGIPPETRDQIFEPFFTTKEEGTGLGLSTVYGISRQCGGVVTVYSEPGRGSTFKVYLPASRSPAGEQPEADAEPRIERPGAAGTVLVAEDDARVRSLIVRVLIRGGFHVIPVASAEEAVRLADSRSEPLDLLLTDVVLPKMSGPELATRLRRTHPELGVLYTSGFTDPGRASQGVLGSEARFLEKPFTPEALLRQVREALTAPGTPATGR